MAAKLIKTWPLMHSRLTTVGGHHMVQHSLIGGPANLP